VKKKGEGGREKVEGTGRKNLLTLGKRVKIMRRRGRWGVNCEKKEMGATGRKKRRTEN